MHPEFVRIEAQHERAGLSQFLAVLVSVASPTPPLGVSGDKH